MLVSYPVVFFQWILKLPVWVMMSVSNLLMKYVFRVPINHVEDVFTRLDLQDYVEGSLTGDQDELEADMFKNALQLKNLKARECMVPRTEIVHVDLEDGIDEVKRVFMETRHSRILVSKGDIDNILGYIHHQNLLQDPVSIEKMIIPIQHIPEVTSVLDIMSMFTRQKNNIAVVVDEFGGTAGIITLEDITEEIFGEIEDEHDQEDYLEEKISETEYLFSARLEIDYLNAKYPSLKFPVGEYETLSGYIVMTSGEIPELDKDFELDDYRFVIEKVTNKKIEEVRVFLINTQD
jgi:CBS domain containing-hemolysin-like protein